MCESATTLLAFRHQMKLYTLSFLVWAMHLMSTSAAPETVANASEQARLLSLERVHVAQQRECSRRVGPFATQDTAWQRRRQAQSQGYSVSGVFPCYDEYGTRGYCFNVFFPC
jgi:hypothetical protein